MRRPVALFVAYAFFLSSSAWAAEEVRPLGMASATGGYSGDIRVGNNCTTSPLGKYYCGLNARHIYFYSDNTVDVDHLYPLAAGTTGFPYVSGGTWTVDSAATYRGRLGTGTPDNTTFWRGDGAWGTPPGTTTTTLPWDNITSTPTTLAGYGITDYTVPTALPWDNITRTLSAGVTDTELSYVDNVTSSIQTQLNAKQAYNAGLAVLSAPTAYRMWISNGVGVITEIEFGADNTCWKSSGPSATPSWGTCGTGAGIGSLNNTTMDNTVIGGTTPASITGTTGVFQTLATTLVSNTELSYVDNVTSPIQTQLNAKQALDNGTFTGEVQGTQFVSSGADNTFGLNVMNTADPTGGYLAAGTMWFDGTRNVIKQRKSDNTVTYEVLSASVAKFSKCFTIDNAIATSDYPVEKFPQAITITNVKVYQIGATNVIGGLEECTGTNGVCTASTDVDADITGTNGAEVSDDGSLSNPGIAAGNWIKWHTTSVSGTNTSLSVCFFYTLNTAY